MNKFLISIQVLFGSSHWLLKLVFFSLPLVFFIGISGYLLSDKLIKGYQNYLYDSYVGLNGRVQVLSNQKEFLKTILKKSSQNNFSSSLKDELQAPIVFKGLNTTITKYAKFVVLEEGYIKEKFGNPNYKTNDIYLNQVFSKSFGNLDLQQFRTLVNEEKIEFEFHTIQIVDTGFLSNEPIIFLSFSFAKKLFPSVDIKAIGVEFLSVDDTQVEFLKNLIKETSSELKVLEYKVLDIIEDTKESREFFAKIKFIQSIIILVVVFLSVSAILLAIILLMKFKEKSLNTLMLLGFKKTDLAKSFSLMIIICGVVIMLLSFALIVLTENFWLNMFQMGHNGYFNITVSDIFTIASALFLSSLISYSTLHWILKGKKYE